MPSEDDEAKKVVEIRMLCELTLSSAEVVRVQDSTDEMFDHEQDRYLNWKQKALEIADSIDDEFFLAAALHWIIRLCVAAGEVHEAKRLLAKIKVDFIREQILEECADLQGSFAQGREAQIEQPDQLTPEEAKKVAREWINGQWSRTAQIRWLMIELADLCISETLRSGQDEWGLRERLSFTFDLVTSLQSAAMPEGMRRIQWEDKESLSEDNRKRLDKALQFVWRRQDPKRSFEEGLGPIGMVIC